MTDDLITQLRTLACSDHDDLSVADEAADKLEQMQVFNAVLKGELENCLDILKRTPDALNDAFNGGVEEREGGSDKRQERYMRDVDELRFEIPKALSRAVTTLNRVEGREDG